MRRRLIALVLAAGAVFGFAALASSSSAAGDLAHGKCVEISPGEWVC